MTGAAQYSKYTDKITCNDLIDYSSTKDIFNTLSKVKAEFFTSYEQNNNEILSGLEPVFECINKSKNILLLENNWDGEGAEGYLQSTWDAASLFLREYAASIYELYEYAIDIPKIYPGPNGSIDIYWETKGYRFVVNIAKEGRYASYYADDYAGQTSEGEFNPMKFNNSFLPKAISF